LFDEKTEGRKSRATVPLSTGIFGKSCTFFCLSKESKKKQNDKRWHLPALFAGFVRQKRGKKIQSKFHLLLNKNGAIFPLLCLKTPAIV
jgi:hypothetical protein